MSKVLFLIVSGKESEEKVNSALISAARIVKSKRFDDFKLLFFCPSEEYIAHLHGEAVDAFRSLVEEHAIDSACSAVAQKKKVDETLSSIGVNLAPFGERLAYFVNMGYTIITF